MTLAEIQKKLKAPKNQHNNFGNYNYRSCEDILEAVKPLLDDMWLTINDEIVPVGNRYYIKATATLHGTDTEISVSAYAREEETKKGMDASQITGSASSYARKYALNGLFLIDDTKDADTRDNSGNGNTGQDKDKKQPEVQTITEGQIASIKQIRTDKQWDLKTMSKYIQETINHSIGKYSELTYDEAEKILVKLNGEK
jgi:hypothetical protein